MRRKTPLTDKPTTPLVLIAARFDNARAMKTGVERVLEAESVLNCENLETERAAVRVEYSIQGMMGLVGSSKMLEGRSENFMVRCFERRIESREGVLSENKLRA
jgi:hypothetical protein